MSDADGDLGPGKRGFEVVVFDFDGVCTPSADEYLTSSGEIASLRPMLVPIVSKLRERGAQVALLSNEFDRKWMTELDNFPEFDRVFVGSDNRIFKPDRRAFQRVLLSVGCEADACLVVDDDETNCRVARSIGCQAIHFDTTDVATMWTDILKARPITP